MKSAAKRSIGRRELLVRTVPACAAACLGLGGADPVAGALGGLPCQETHKFDGKMDRTFTPREFATAANRGFIQLIRTLRQEMNDGEVIRLLRMNSQEIGRQQGAVHAGMVSENSFENFTSVFRSMITGDSLTGEVVQDTEGIFELKMTECIWAEVFRDAGLGGDIGHSAVCNMDYAWPPAFNPAFRMERSKTLMQGHDCCNHRYIDTAVE